LGVKSVGVREIAVPVTVFTVLRRELEKEAGTLPAVKSLHHAGYEVGTEAAVGFAGGDGDRATELSRTAFWHRMERFFRSKGWGSVQHEDAHPGVGILTSSDWVESASQEIDPEGTCSFSTGFLAGLLSAITDRPIAVLEVTCRTRGDDACRFAFGSEVVVHELYGRMLEGSDLRGALTEIQ
jgi:predicted hydrocarbon binding protein